MRVSMPSAGYSHFYKSRFSTRRYTKWRCQCPRRAILISTGYLGYHRFGCRRCVNALGGLFSFLLRMAPICLSLCRSVSMPSAGYSHFYRFQKSRGLEKMYMVSMPSAGYSHFYNVLSNEINQVRNECQCPRRAILISTLMEILIQIQLS